MSAVHLCHLCLSFSGLISNFDRCCQIRLLSRLPREKRRRAYEWIEGRGGKEAVSEVMALVKAEYERQQKAGKSVA